MQTNNLFIALLQLYSDSAILILIKQRGDGMNKVEIIGRLCRDMELRYSQSANPVAVGRTSLAVNRRFKKEGEQDADFINVLAFGKTAELMEKHLKKGDQVAIAGRIQTGSYDKDGQKHYTFEVVVEEMTFIGGAKGTTTSSQPVDGNMEEDDDLPF